MTNGTGQWRNCWKNEKPFLPYVPASVLPLSFRLRHRQPHKLPCVLLWNAAAGLRDPEKLFCISSVYGVSEKAPPEIPDCRFLDLFSGSGGIGIEALSRGAEFAVFVEKNPKACACIRENLTFTKLAEHGKLLNMDVLQALRSLEGEEAFDCIFMDPPYNKDLERQVLEYLKDSSLANTDTLIVTEADLHTDFSYVEELGYELEAYRFLYNES